MSRFGNGDGTFQAPVSYNPGFSASFLETGDFNGDGRVDIAVAGAFGVGVLLGNGDGTFANGWEYRYTTEYLASGISVGDFNGDGVADLALAALSSESVTVFLGNGDGTFGSPASYNIGAIGTVLITGDFNRDGKSDIAVGGGQGLRILFGNGDGTFQPATNIAPAASYAASGDFNKDGIPDLAIAVNGGVELLLGNGDGTFQAPAPAPIAAGTPATSLAVGDFNGDGNPDLVVSNGYEGVVNFTSPNTVTVLLGDGEGSFPSSYSVNAGQGVTPLAVGEFNGDGRSDVAAGTALCPSSLTILLGVRAPLQLSCAPAPVPAAVGAPYPIACAASGSVAPYTYSISAGNLPAGLTLNPATGAIAGILTTTGLFTFTVQASDSDAPPQSGSESVSVSVAAPLIMTPSALPAGVSGIAWSSALAGGGTAPYACSVATGTLPSGVTLNPATCALAGTPASAGAFSFAINAIDSASPAQTAAQTYTLTVESALAITTTSLPPATTGSPYSAIASASGGAAPFAWSLSAGTLPAPLTLIPASGVIAGIPAAKGAYNFTLQAKDALQSAQKPLTLNVYDPLAITTATLPSGFSGQAYATSLAASGGSGGYSWKPWDYL